MLFKTYFSGAEYSVTLIICNAGYVFRINFKSTRLDTNFYFNTIQCLHLQNRT